MPGLIAGEGRKDVRENCRILRPYIIWKRRKEQLIEKTLICMIKQEEEKKKKEEEDRKRLEKEQRISRIQQLEKELEKVREKKNHLEENIKSLQENKHELFIQLKNSLMAKEFERREKFTGAPEGQIVPGSMNIATYGGHASHQQQQLIRLPFQNVPQESTPSFQQQSIHNQGMPLQFGQAQMMMQLGNTAQQGQFSIQGPTMGSSLKPFDQNIS